MIIDALITGFERGLRLTVALLTLALTTSAGEAFYLRIDGPGTASVVLSEASGAAYLTDGGMAGAAGIRGASIGGQPVLAFLRDRGVERLVFTCTHPHADHMAGLADAVTQDPRILEFAKLTFVGAGPQSDALFNLYKEAWSERPSKPPAEFLDATGRNAFAGFSGSASDLEVENFVYEPTTTSIHGNAVVMQYTLVEGRQRSRIVDFDDADTGLVASWAAWARQDSGRKPDVIVVPHHGSNDTDLSPLLSPDLRPRSAILTVDAANRYGHPAAGQHLALLGALGMGNVHVTAATGNVRVTEYGISALEDSLALEQTLRRVIEPQVRRAERRIERIEERAFASGIVEDAAVANARSSLAELLSLQQTYASGMVMPTRELLWPAEMPAYSDAVEGDRRSGLGDYEARRDQALVHAAALPGASRFEAALSGLPVFGGVLLGNAPLQCDADVSAVSFELGESDVDGALDAPAVPRIVVSRPSGDAVFDATSTTELWCAYNLVQPSEGLRSEFPYLGPEDCEIIGMAGRSGDTWDFAIHPAIAGTIFARDGMRLDMLLSQLTEVSRSGEPLPGNDLSSVDWKGLGYSSYQWFDAPARLVISEGSIRVVPSQGPRTTLMRARLARRQLPTWFDPRESEDSLFRETQSRFALRSQPTGEAGGRVWRELRAEVDGELRASPTTTLTPGIGGRERLLYDGSDALRRIDRLARTAAVLRWARCALGRDLPPLPPSIQPILRAVEPQLSGVHVLSRR